MSWLFSKAMMEAYGNLHSSPEPVAEYSAESCLDGEPSAQLNVMPTPHKFWRNDKTMEFSKLSQFGLTLRLLTVDHGEALLTSYLAAFRAKTSARQEKVQELPVSDQACGKKWPGLLARYNPDTCSWKTAQCSLLEDLELSLETWPRWGSMRNGECYLRPMLERLTCAKESGLWATPTAVYGGVPKVSEWKGTYFLKPNGKKAQTRLNDQVVMAGNSFPTPTASASASKGSSPASLVRKDGKSRVNDRLDHSVMASNGGQLNPTWVEWLMGWPLGWTDLKALVTDKCHCVQLQHTSCSEQGLSKEAA